MDLKEKLLNYYHISTEEYEQITRPIEEIVLPNSNNLIGMDKAISRIKLAIKNKEKIVIYGDYDCDGVMATSIMVKTFAMLDYPVGYYIPSRYLDGYGLTKERILQFKEKGYSLIITVDNGISLVDEVAFANEQGLDVIITDHHEIGDVLPDAYVIIHPTLSKLGKIIASGGAMAYYLSCSLLGKSDEYLLSMAATSLISDLMSLKEYNRDMVRLGLYYLNKNQYLPFVLLNSDTHFNEFALSLKIAPKVNALGRIIEDNKINRLVTYFTSSNSEEIYKIHDYIESVNLARKELTSSSSDELGEIDENKASIVKIATVKEGLIGLLASRLVNEYNKPTVIFTIDESNPDQLKGSARSKDGFNITKAFASLKKYIIRSGGHALAGGLTILRKDFDSFASEFDALAYQYQFVNNDISPIEIGLQDINQSNYEIIETFSPFGQGMKEPSFIINGIKTASLTYMSMGKHISTSISLSSRLVGFFCPHEQVSKFDYINIVGTIRKSYFRGSSSVDFLIAEYRAKN